MDPGKKNAGKKEHIKMRTEANWAVRTCSDFFLPLSTFLQNVHFTLFPKMFVEDTLQRKQKKQKSVSPRDEGWVREEMARQKNAWVCALPAEPSAPNGPRASTPAAALGHHTA